MKKFLLLGSLIGLSAIAFSINPSGPLCFYIETYQACSQTDQYQQYVVCESEGGYKWSCISELPILNEPVDVCKEVKPYQYGKRICYEKNTTAKCQYRKAVCGDDPGECGLEGDFTVIEVKNQGINGEICVGIPYKPIGR